MPGTSLMFSIFKDIRLHPFTGFFYPNQPIVTVVSLGSEISWLPLFLAWRLENEDLAAIKQERPAAIWVQHL